MLRVKQRKATSKTSRAGDMELEERSGKAEPACDKGVGLVSEQRVKCLLPHFLYFCLLLNYHPGFKAKRTFHYSSVVRHGLYWSETEVPSGLHSLWTFQDLPCLFQSMEATHTLAPSYCLPLPTLHPLTGLL